jgi:RHS repeat-associated protein
VFHHGSLTQARKLAMVCFAFGLIPVIFKNQGAAQTVAPNVAVGSAPTSVYDAGEIDNPNPVNGNLFLDIPLVSFPQRGHQLKLNFKILYNDKKWFIYNYCLATTYVPCGSPSNIWTWSQTPQIPGREWPSNMGVFVTDDQHLDFGTDDAQSGYGGNNEGGAPGSGNGYQQYSVAAHIYSYFVSGSDGAKHYLGDSSYYTCTAAGGGSCPTIPYYPDDNYPADDASGFIGGASFKTQQYTVIGPDGVSYTPGTVTDTAGNVISSGSNGWDDSIGRHIPGTATGVGTSSTVQSTQDFKPGSAIPGIPMASVPAACPALTEQAREWDLPGVSGNSNTYYLCYRTFSYSTNFNAAAANNDGYSASEATGTSVLMSAIVLPNGQQYTFSYDNYLSLTSLTLPTGATITYTWQNVPFAMGGSTSPVNRALATRTVNPGNGQPSRTWRYAWYPGAPIVPGNGGTVTYASMYSIVTDPQGNDTERVLGGKDLAGTIIGGDVAISIAKYAGCSPHNAGCSSGGKLLQSEAYIFRKAGGAPYPSAPSSSTSGFFEPSTTVTSVITGQSVLVSKKVLTYAPGYGTCTIVGYPPASNFQQNLSSYPVQTYQVTPCTDPNKVIEEDQYDWGAGAPGQLIKKTFTQYEWQNDVSTSTNICQNSGQTGYLAANLSNLPQCVLTQAGAQDAVAAGTTLSETDYNYDESPSPTGPHGNLTSTTHWLSTGASPTTQTVYNNQGMPTLQYDALGNKTQIVYDSTGAFPQTVILPQTVSYPNGQVVKHSEGYQFDPNTGRTLSHTDQNNNTTMYSYVDPTTGAADPLNRLRKITYPATIDGSTGTSAQGSKTYTYVDSVGQLSVTETTTQNANGGSVQRMTAFDGLGEVIHSYQTSDNEGQVTIDTNYDSMGRVSSVTNPYRSTTDSTYGITVTKYDALGREIIVTHPGGSSQQWCYVGVAIAGQSNCLNNYSSKGGTWIDSSDETGRHWQRVSDGAGRLKAVVEPGPNALPSLETDYTYDSLNNLTRVDQWGGSAFGGAGQGGGERVRTFKYDSLSRLVSGCNPEVLAGSGSCATANTWSNWYSYDSNGNIKSKSSGLGTVYFCYDSLNRAVGKAYSNLDCSQMSSLAAYFTYDVLPSGLPPLPAGITATNPIGRLTTAVALDGSNVISQETDYVADAMGRVTDLLECTPANCSGAPYEVDYTYDLVGNVTSSTNGLPPNSSGTGTSTPNIKLSMAYDSVNRLTQVTSNWDGTQYAPSPAQVPLPTGLFEASMNPSNAGYSALNLLQNAQLGFSPSNPGQSLLTLNRAYDNRSRIISEIDTAPNAASSSSSHGSVTILGAEQQAPMKPSPSTGVITIGGAEGTSGTQQVCVNQWIVNEQHYAPVCTAEPIYDTGSLTVYVNGFSATATYGAGSTASTLASALAYALNAPSSPVTATASGNVVTLTSINVGAGTNYNYSISTGNDFEGCVAGYQMYGGSNGGTTVSDTGTVSMTVNGTTASTSYGPGSTPQSIAAVLASAIQSNLGGTLNASASGGTINLTSNQTGASADWGISTAYTFNGTQFASPSFSPVAIGMTGGASAGSDSSGTISFAGVEQQSTGIGTPSSGTISITGVERSTQICPANTRIHSDCTLVPDTGSLTVFVNGFSVTTNTGAGSTDPSVAAAIATALNTTGSPVSATSSGNLVTITTLATGPNTNYNVSISNSGDFTGTVSTGTLAGGALGPVQADSGTVSVTVNGQTTTVPWGQGSTTQSIASSLASALQAQAGGFLNAAANGGAVLLTSNQASSSNNWGITVAVNDTAGSSVTPSFSATASGMNGAVTPTTSPQIVYSYSIPNGNGYAANGNIMNVSDSVTGSWTYSYDNLNRLTQATGVSGLFAGTMVAGQVLTWSYDPFGNRLTQTSNTQALPSGSAQFNGANNRASGFGLAGSPAQSTDSLQYDAEGDSIGQDGNVLQVYDPEGRLCAVQSPSGGAMGYIYDAAGTRVAKGSISTLNCAPSQNGFAITSSYILGLGGEELTEMTGPASSIWDHSNVYADGHLIVTYRGSKAYFALNDWLGTKRVTYSTDGTVSSYASLPFGDALTTVGVDPSEQHLTGKDRDPESGLDYFEARYYNSNIGRFMSPDWSAKADPVPYAKLDNPQSLNLYAFVGNNPMSRVDMDGHTYLERYLEQNSASLELAAFTQNQQDQLAQKKAQAQAQQNLTSLTNVIYNETSAFSPNPNAKPNTTGSAEDLHNGRVAVGEVAEGILTGKHPERVLAKTELSKREAAAIKAGYGPAVAAYGDAKTAAAEVLAGSNATNGATQYRTRFSSDVTTNVGRDGPKVPGTPVSQHFGPFSSSLGGSGIGVIVIAQ